MDDIQNTYVEKTGKSAAIYARAQKIMPSGNARTVLFYDPYPAYSRGGKGSRIWDADGNERIDYCFSYTSLILGHCHSKVIEALSNQLKNGTGLGQPTVLEVELAERVAKRVPSAEKVRFTATGTEACMNAIRAVRGRSKKDKIVVFGGAYHGSSDSVSVKGLAFSAGGIPETVARDTIVTPFGEYHSLESILKRNRKKVAGIMIEPVLAAGGMVVPEIDFMKGVQELARLHGIPLIFDEIVTGFRLAKGGFQERFNLEPDLTTLGKNLTGGMPGGAIVGPEDIMDEMFAFRTNPAGPPQIPISGTYNAFPLSMAAGIATLDELNSAAYEQIDRTGQKMREGIETIARELGLTNIQVSGIGSLFHIHFSKRPIRRYDDIKKEDKTLLWLLDLDLLNRGVYLSPSHFCCTSTASSDEDVAKTLDVLKLSLKALTPRAASLQPRI